MQPAHATHERVGIKDVLGALKHRRVWLIGVSLAFLVVAGAYAVLARPAYTSTAQLFVDPRNRHTPKDDPLQNAVPGDGLLLVESQLKITSDEVLLRVVEKAHLEEDPEFNGDRAGFIRKALSAIGFAKPINPKLAALRNLRLKIATKRIDRSFVIEVMASADTAADRATAITTALAAAYLDEQAGADQAGGQTLYCCRIECVVACGHAQTDNGNSFCSYDAAPQRAQT